MLEKSEGDLLHKPPRKLGKDRLVDKKLLLFAYFFLGVFESFFSICMFFVYLYTHGGYRPSEIFLAYEKWQPGYMGKFFNKKDLDNLHFTAQTVTFVSLVMVQTFGNVFITRTRKLSLWQSFPVHKAHKNLWLFAAQFVSVAFMLLVVYVPFFNHLFNTRHVPVEFYFIPLGFCFIFIFADEFRKFMVRRRVKIFVKTAW